MPRKLFEQEDINIYSLLSDERLVRPQSFAEVTLLQEAIISILRKYVEKYYRVCQERWNSNHMVYGVLDISNNNFRQYMVRIQRNEAELIGAIKKLIDEGKRIYETETRELPNVHFGRYLYQLLLVERGDRVKSDPPAGVDYLKPLFEAG